MPLSQPSFLEAPSGKCEKSDVMRWVGERILPGGDRLELENMSSPQKPTFMTRTQFPYFKMANYSVPI